MEKKKKKKKTVRTRVYLGTQELRAMAFLQLFPNFKEADPNTILKSCLMIVAVDAKVKLEAAKKGETDEQQTDKHSDE